MNLLSYILFSFGYSGGLGGLPPVVGRAPEAITSYRGGGGMSVFSLVDKAQVFFIGFVCYFFIG